jgi:CheY-like chemotaxis protein
MCDEPLILLVEDREDDVLLIRRSFDQAGINNPIHVASDGEQAIRYLSGHDKYSDRCAYPFPDLVLLDLKLPKIDGFEVLQWICTNSQLPGLRVVVLTSSDNIHDVNLAYSLGANSFLVKPADFTRYAQLSVFISDTWFQWRKRPVAQESANDPANNRPPKDKKVLLRDRDSQRFYAAHSTWVRDKQNAIDFGSSRAFKPIGSSPSFPLRPSVKDFVLISD